MMDSLYRESITLAIVNALPCGHNRCEIICGVIDVIVLYGNEHNGRDCPFCVRSSIITGSVDGSSISFDGGFTIFDMADPACFQKAADWIGAYRSRCYSNFGLPTRVVK